MRIQRSEAGGPLVAAVTGDDRRCGTTGEARAEQREPGEAMRDDRRGVRRRMGVMGLGFRGQGMGAPPPWLICGSPQRADPTVGESCIQRSGGGRG